MSNVVYLHSAPLSGESRIGTGVSLQPPRDDETALSLLDAGFLYLDRPRAPLQIGAVLTVDGTELRDEVEALLAARLKQLPRFAQRPLPVPFSVGHPRWGRAPGFRVSDHVFSWAVPASEGVPVASRQLHRLLGEPLPPDRPLWDLHLFESRSTQTTALLLRVHHCMLDGVGGVAALSLLVDGRDEEMTWEAATDGSTEAEGGWSRLHRALRQEAARHREAASTAARYLGNPRAAQEWASRAWRSVRGAGEWMRQEVPEQLWNGRLSRDRHLATIAVSMDWIREIRAERGCRFNDVVLCLIGGGLARYLARAGAETGLPLQALVPVNRRSSTDAFGATGNRIAVMRAAIPVDGTSEVQRLSRIRHVTAPLMARRAWEDSEGWLALLSALPPAVVAPIARSVRMGRIANLVVTNVAGPGEKISLCGRPVREILPIVPIYHRLGLGVAAFSYAGQLSLTLHADAQQLPDLDRLAADVGAAAAALHGDAKAHA